MGPIRRALKRLAAKLSMNHRRLKHRQHKAIRFARRARFNHDKAVAAEEAADHRRKHGHTGRVKDKEAQRSHRRAHTFQNKAQWWTARVKESQRAIHHLDKLQVVKEAELTKWRKAHKLTVRGDTVTGGTARNRLKTAALAAAAKCANGSRRNVYSQAGSYTVDHGITGEPSGYRTDCSQFVTSMYRSAGLPDPNGEGWSGGYTGTLVREGRPVSRAELKPGDLVIYGGGVGHHVEMYVGPGDRTIGHGSAPVDEGVINLFGDSDYRMFRYV